MKELAKKINKSKTYEASKADILDLMERLGLSESYTQANSLCNGNCTYEIGMFIAKAFDMINMVPKMKWLPKEILKLYK